MGTDDQVTKAATDWYQNITTIPGYAIDPQDIIDAFKAGHRLATDPRAAPPAPGVPREIMWDFVYYIRLDKPPYCEPRFIGMPCDEYDGIQDAIEALFADPNTMRVYQLRQCYGIGRRRGE